MLTNTLLGRCPLYLSLAMAEATASADQVMVLKEVLGDVDEAVARFCIARAEGGALSHHVGSASVGVAGRCSRRPGTIAAYTLFLPCCPAGVPPGCPCAAWRPHLRF